MSRIKWAFFHGLYDVRKIGFRLNGWDNTLFSKNAILEKLNNDYPKMSFMIEDFKDSEGNLGKSQIIWWRRKW